MSSHFASAERAETEIPPDDRLQLSMSVASKQMEELIDAYIRVESFLFPRW